jgi:hypothetical protein
MECGTIRQTKEVWVYLMMMLLLMTIDLIWVKDKFNDHN